MHDGLPGMKWILYSVVVLCSFMRAAWAADDPTNPTPCAWQQRNLSAAQPNTPEAKHWRDVYKECATVAFADTKDAWAGTLDKLPSGEWQYLMVSDDGTFATFGSHRHSSREGDIVAIWIRYEFRTPQETGEPFKSLVERDEYDCVRIAARRISYTHYAENNLGTVMSSHTEQFQAHDGWVPVIPGSTGEFLLDWACKTTPPGLQATKPRAAQ